ncbi:hypothetical protein SERLADRAFT_460017, partial [Serpula lacrymans var. lacrymans S7.9]
MLAFQAEFPLIIIRIGACLHDGLFMSCQIHRLGSTSFCYVRFCTVPQASHRRSSNTYYC